MFILYRPLFHSACCCSTLLPGMICKIDVLSFCTISAQIRDQIQVYSTSSRGYFAGGRKITFPQPLRSKVACTPHQNGKSSTPDRACLTGELCLIIGDSLSDLLSTHAHVCVCICVYTLACVCTPV